MMSSGSCNTRSRRFWPAFDESPVENRAGARSGGFTGTSAEEPAHRSHVREAGPGRKPTRGRPLALWTAAWALGPAFVLAPPTLAQSERGGRIEVSAPITPRARNVDLRDLPLARRWKPGDPIKDIPRRFYPSEPPRRPAPRGFGLDPLLDAQKKASPSGPGTLSRTFINVDGQGFTGRMPPDTVGDVGANYYIQATNHPDGAIFSVYDKSDGHLVAGPTHLSSLAFEGDPCKVGYSDPVVLYDHLADRWVLAEMAAKQIGRPKRALCVYISKTSDPVSGGWWDYEVSYTEEPDYPKLAVWPTGDGDSDAYLITTNQGSGPRVTACDRLSMLSGQSIFCVSDVVPKLKGFGFQALTPGDLDGPPPPADSPAYFIRHRDDEVHDQPFGDPWDPWHDFLELFEYRIHFSNPGSSSLTGPTRIPIAEFDSDLCGVSSTSCIPQPGTSSPDLDPVPEVAMWRLQYRHFADHETLVGNLTTDVTGVDQGGIRWFELRKSSLVPWELHQEGTFAPDLGNRWIGSIAMDGAGNIALGYSVSSTSTYPSIRYTGRQASDPLGTMPLGERSIVDGTGSQGGNRWGDYSAMSVDPVDDTTFWYTNEYVDSSGLWRTRLASFRLTSSVQFLQPTHQAVIPSRPTEILVVAGDDEPIPVFPGVSVEVRQGAAVTTLPMTYYGFCSTVPNCTCDLPHCDVYKADWDATNASGAFDLEAVVHFSGGDVETARIAVTVQPIDLPLVSSLAPSWGYSWLATPLVITGSNFHRPLDGITTTDVKLGTQSVPFTAVSDTEIQATALPGSGTVPVTVTTTKGSSSGGPTFRYESGLPVVSGLTPNWGFAWLATPVAITGSKFHRPAYGITTTAVMFGTQSVPFTVVSDTEIHATAPPGSGIVSVTVVNTRGSSSGGPSFRYESGLPAISGVSPGSGSELGGEIVEIHGGNFAVQVPGFAVTAVRFGAAAAQAVEIIDNENIRATTPPGPGLVSITVETTLGSVTSGPIFQYEPPNPYVDKLWEWSGGGYFGIQVGTVGDVNGDGLDDVAVSDANSTTVYDGATGAVVATLSADNPPHYSPVAALGDINNDGTDDFAVGFSNAHQNNHWGKVVAYSGSTLAPLWTTWGPQPQPNVSRFGFRMDVAGDTNGDGMLDLVVGSDGEDSFPPYSTQAFILSGANGSIRISFPVDDPGTPLAVAGLGDVNDDGHSDLAVANFAGRDNEGYLAVIDGNAGWPPSIQTLNHPGASDGYGKSLAGLGRTDAAAAAFIAGAPGVDGSRGKAYVYHEGGDGVVLWNSITGEAAGDRFGESVAVLDDIDGDGSPEFAIGAPYHDTASADTGRVYIYSPATGQILTTIDGRNAGELFGYRLGYAGDVNGDGTGDLVVGLPSARKAYVYALHGQNRPPTLSSTISAVTVRVQNWVDFDVHASDPDALDLLTITVSGAPSGATFGPATGRGAVDGRFRWLPGPAQVGQYQVTFVVSDGRGGTSGPVAVTITVLPPPELRVTVSRVNGGLGVVTSDINGLSGQPISCPYHCSENFPWNTSVMLQAAPLPGSRFGGWGGACSGTGPCFVTMNGDRQASATFEALPAPPAPPTNLVAASRGPAEIRLAWRDNATNESAFEIEKRNPEPTATVAEEGSGAGAKETSDWARIATVPANVTSYTVSGLTPGTYTFRVRATNAGGVSAYSNEATGTTLPRAPTGLVVQLSNVTPTSGTITLTWLDNAANETSYEVERRTATSGYARIATLGAGVTSLTIAAATPDRYFFRVRAVNSGGASAYTNEASPPGPAAPSDLVATVVSTAQVNLSWSDRSGNETAFVVERKALNGNYAVLAQVGGNVTSYPDTSVGANTTYVYRVKATNAWGGSEYSNQASAVTSQAPPDAPTNMTADHVVGRKVFLEWLDNSYNETEFVVEYQQNGGVWTQLATVSASAGQYGSYMAGLSPGTVYYFRVLARNSYGSSGYAYSDGMGVTVPPAARSLSVSVSGNGVVKDVVILDHGAHRHDFFGELISCPYHCSDWPGDGDPVTLRGEPLPGNRFGGWGGACTGNGDCTVIMTTNKSVSATFLAGP